MSTDVVAKDPMYTWTFSHRSLLIRLYLWVYAPDNPSSTTFCKLFWGTILTPITLPLTILIKMSGYAIKGVVWLGRHSGVPQIFRMLDHWQDRRIAARRTEFDRRYEEPEPPRVVVVTPVPKKPNVPTKIVVWTSHQADKVVAYFQEHPEITEKANVVMGYTGKFFVRCVFYPLMILVPTAAFAFVAWQIEMHWHGPANGLLWFGHELLHYAWRMLELVGLWALLCVGAFAGLTILIVGSCWMSVQYDKMFPSKYGGPSSIAAIPSSRESWRRKEDAGIVYQGGHIMAERWGDSLATAGNVVVWPFKMVGLALVGILMVLWTIACAFGRGTRNTGRFMVAGHHTVKYRTCPRITITK